ncbi:hypothetical protein JCM1841_003493 [Sporobolomyces salmonicolor]
MAQKVPQPTPSTANAPAAQPATKKRPAASEIDDIFAKKPKVPPAVAASASATPAAAGSSGVKKKNKKGKDKGESAGQGIEKEEDAPAPSKRVPEEVVDTSKMIEAYKPTVEQAVKRAKDMTDEERKAAEEEDRFRDSRGTRKKTEDGLPIYDVTELKIGLGGDTELCPFDCECCF